MPATKNVKQPLSSKSYVLIALLGLILAILALVGYISYSDKLAENDLLGIVFYPVILIFGVAVSAFIFGAMNSYATLKGTKFDSKYNLSGPIVGVVLVVLGAYLLPSSGNKNITLTVRLFSYNNEALKSGSVKAYFRNEIIEKAVDPNGQVLFFVNDNKEDSIKIEASADGYKNAIRLMKVKKSQSLNIVMEKPQNLKIFGKIINADEQPIPGVEINIMNTDFITSTISNGEYTLIFSGHNIGDEISVITSHPKFKDKIVKVVLNEVNNRVDITLSNLP